MTVIHISTGSSRYETQWKNRETTWDQLAEKLAHSQATGETHKAYMAMPKAKQSNIKDIGGFVGGWLSEGKRSARSVLDRSVITLDADTVSSTDQFMNDLEAAVPFVDAVIYGTHKYAPDRPRLRTVICLSRAVQPDEYEAIARKIAEKIGMHYFDATTFQPSRLMYWPSHSTDIEPYYERLYGSPLDADEVLSEYQDWHDISFWPMAEGEQDLHKRAEKQADPLEKKGLVGVFCRAYSIQDAIAKFLPDVYEEGTGGRYTYKAGTGKNGLVIYGDGRWAYSNHGTDPASMQLCNAFDLVRIHLYGHLDIGQDKTGTKAPSYQAMTDMVVKDDGYKQEYFQEKQQEAVEDFSDSDDVNNTSWKNDLIITGHGLAKLLQNPIMILEHDPKLQGVGRNKLTGIIMAQSDLPWGDPAPRSWGEADDVQLCTYIEKTYGSLPKQLICDALTKVADDRSYNPIRDYLEHLPAWDGIHRIDSLLVVYLGADSSEYTRAVTRKTLIAAIRRIYHPGCKFDYMLVLVGKTGIGKSTLWAKLGGQWFSDSLSLEDMRDKTAAEKLQGFWLLEIGEMQGARKADVNNVKSFLSRQSDNYRPAYGHYVEEHPRSCIIVGTTNEEEGFLRDQTGNRRFWPVYVTGKGTKNVWEMSTDEVSQIWAEAMVLNKKNEPLHLSPELEKIAAEMQQKAMESDDRMGAVEIFLNTPLPEDWYSMSIEERADWFRDDPKFRRKTEHMIQRTQICVPEIWCECYLQPYARLERMDSRNIGAIMAKMEGWELIGSRQSPGYGGKQKIWRRKRAT